jgi:hypothetical protein
MKPVEIAIIVVAGVSIGAVVLYEFLTNTQAIIDKLPLDGLVPKAPGQTQAAADIGATSVVTSTGQRVALQDVTPGNPNNPDTYEGGVTNPPVLTGTSSEESASTKAYYQALSNNTAARSTAT